MDGMSPKDSTDRLTHARLDRFLCNIWVNTRMSQSYYKTIMDGSPKTKGEEVLSSPFGNAFALL